MVDGDDEAQAGRGDARGDEGGGGETQAGEGAARAGAEAQGGKTPGVVSLCETDRPQ
jgi:hypothetical protein